MMCTSRSRTGRCAETPSVDRLAGNDRQEKKRRRQDTAARYIGYQVIKTSSGAGEPRAQDELDELWSVFGRSHYQFETPIGQARRGSSSCSTEQKSFEPSFEPRRLVANTPALRRAWSRISSWSTYKPNATEDTGGPSCVPTTRPGHVQLSNPCSCRRALALVGVSGVSPLRREPILSALAHPWLMRWPAVPHPAA